jgi:ribosomal protein S18 acetylase RimI-like enzyme
VEEKDGEPATDFVKVEFDAFGVPVVEGLINEAVDVYDRRRWKVGQPVIESFVGYEFVQLNPPRISVSAVDSMCFCCPYRGNTPVATGTVVMRKEDQVATIVAIGCAHGFRGKGYGARIFSKCVQTAIDAGFKSIVLISSEEGVDLYARQGFKRIGGGSVSMITLA